jgi:hypothetical protein
MFIEDGKGKSGNASVSWVQRLNVSSKSEDRKFYASRDFGLCYNAVFDNITATDGDYTAYLKNTSSTYNLFVSEIEFHSLLATKWKIWQVTGTAASGETVTPSELNLSKSIPADAIAMAGDTSITGLTTVQQVGSHRNTPTGDSGMNFRGCLILGPGDAIAIELDVGVSGLVSHDMFFWFEPIGAS